MPGASIFAKIPLEVTTVNAEKDTNKQQLDMVVKVCIMSILFTYMFMYYVYARPCCILEPKASGCMCIPGINCDILMDTHTDGVKSTSDHVSRLVFLFSCPENPSINHCLFQELLMILYKYMYMYV